MEFFQAYANDDNTENASSPVSTNQQEKSNSTITTTAAATINSNIHVNLEPPVAAAAFSNNSVSNSATTTSTGTKQMASSSGGELVLHQESESRRRDVNRNVAAADDEVDDFGPVNPTRVGTSNPVDSGKENATQKASDSSNTDTTVSIFQHDDEDQSHPADSTTTLAVLNEYNTKEANSEELVGANLLGQSIVGKVKPISFDDYTFQRNYKGSSSGGKKRKRDTVSATVDTAVSGTAESSDANEISEEDASAFPKQAFILDKKMQEKMEQQRIKREEREQREIKRQRREAMQPKVEFHLERKRDYKGRTFMWAPSWLKPLKRSVPVKCYPPKKLLHTFEGHTKGVSSIEFFPRFGHLLLSADYDGTVKLWDVMSHRKCIMTYKLHRKAVSDISFRSDGRQFLSSGFDRSTYLWDTEKGKVISTYKNNTVHLCCKFHPLQERNHQFLVGQENAEITQWDTRSNQLVLTYAQHKDAVKHIEFLRGRNGAYTTFASTSDDKSMCIWFFTHKGKGVPTEIKKVEDPNNMGFHYLRQHPRQNMFLVGGFNSSISCYSGNHPLYSFNRHMTFLIPKTKRPTVSCGFDVSHDGEIVLSGDADGKVHMWRYQYSKSHKSFNAHSGACKRVLWHPIENSKMISCGEDGLIKLWE